MNHKMYYAIVISLLSALAALVIGCAEHETPTTGETVAPVAAEVKKQTMPRIRGQ